MSGLIELSLSGTARDLSVVVAAPDAEATIGGAFESRRDIRRGSGGAAVRVGPGTVWLQLALPTLDAFGPCPPDRLLNRHVRPLLKALTKALGLPVSYFGRDWVSAQGRPIGMVSFAHEARTNRALFEAFIAVTTPLVDSSSPPRATFRDKTPATLADLRPSVTVSKVIDALRDAWPSEVARIDADGLGGVAAAPSWTEIARLEDAMGPVLAMRDEHGHLRVGGALMASSDAIESLEASLVRSSIALLSRDAVALAVAEAFASAVLFGARAESLVEVIDRAQNVAWSTVEK